MPQNYGNQLQTFNSFSKILYKYQLEVSIVCTLLSLWMLVQLIAFVNYYFYLLLLLHSYFEYAY